MKGRDEKKRILAKGVKEKKDQREGYPRKNLVQISKRDSGDG